ncbi:MOSC domain-containing protein [Gilvimarinus agarilyticus]|uniref:MOSC domain-containing protein n=1 Tax=Gilvimarinus agarilyticus TaxID=679259 RepID=UPI0005A1A465|nr:MOSC N-terminal beta barrel domain-containing protein [Gilvimarinus agarilyticus]
MKIGTIQSIWRYPVKGMAGELLRSCWLDTNGLAGDRLWAVQDVKRQEIQSCKFRPQLLQCRAQSLASGGVVIRFPDGELLPSRAEKTNQRISQLLGHPSVLQPLRPADDTDFYRRHKQDDDTWLAELKATFEREAGEPLPDLDNLPPAMQEYVSVLGTFFLVSPLHLLTTASLFHMQACNPGSDWHVERFRPNIVINTEPALQGLVEQGWINHRLKIGDVTVACNGAAPRCGAVVKPQGELAEDKSILRSIVKEADQNLGVYSDIQNGGTINVGDDVLLLD